MEPQGGADDLERRMSAVERDVADARVLAAGADRDVSEVRAELRAHIALLNALRETQIEHDRNFGIIERHFEVLHAGLRHITDLLEDRQN